MNHRALSVLPLWLYPTNIPEKNLSDKEKALANQLSVNRSKQYKHSRSHIRYALSQLWNISPLKIPLEASPGKAPKLSKGWGYISISHCYDALLIGWSAERIGVDIERSDRQFAAQRIANRFYLREEKQLLEQLNEEDFHQAVLRKWIDKEASIKWQRGRINKDLSEWKCIDQSSSAIHISLGYKVNIQRLSVGPWYMSIASETNKLGKPIMLCIDSSCPSKMLLNL